MKTIKVTNKMYNSLMELSKEINNQNHLHTAMPYLFQVETEIQVAAYEGCGETIWVNEEGETLSSDEEIVKYVSDWIYDNGSDTIVEDMDMDDFTDFMQEIIDESWRTVNVSVEKVYKNAFFTSKGCKEHIASNEHHYNNPRAFLNHAFRNPEMELVYKLLCEISGGKIHK